MSSLDATVSMLEAILSDLAESRQQISDGKGLDMEDALKRMGEQHGFI